MTDSTARPTIVFLDDQDDREDRKADLERLTGCSVCFVPLQGQDLMATVRQVSRDVPSPDLVLVDHVLDRTSPNSQELIKKGASIVPMLREHWTNCPILAVTAAYDECVRDLSSKSYEEVFPLDALSSLAEYIPSIIAGYRALHKEKLSADRLVALLRCPTDQAETMACSFPADMRRKWDQADCPHRIYRWFRHSFHRKPGFVYDRQWASLLVGVAIEHFPAYEPRLVAAKYEGLFASNDDPRWWKAALYALALPKSSERFTVPIQQAAQATLGIAKEHVALCWQCDEPWPEVMACVDKLSVDKSDMRPMHLRCTQVHPLSASEPFFEELRVMLED